MSHYIAELIIRAESATGEAKQSAESAAAEAIMNLWANRDGAAWRTKPLDGFDRVFATLDRLAREPSRWGYFRLFDDESRPTVEQTRNDILLAAACDLDHHLHRLVRAVVALAAREAESKNEPWVLAGLELAEDDQSRAIRRLRTLQLRARLRLAHADTEHQEQMPNLHDEGPMLDALTASISDAADAFLRIQSTLSPTAHSAADDERPAD